MSMSSLILCAITLLIVGSAATVMLVWTFSHVALQRAQEHGRYAGLGDADNDEYEAAPPAKGARQKDSRSIVEI